MIVRKKEKKREYIHLMLKALSSCPPEQVKWSHALGSPAHSVRKKQASAPESVMAKSVSSRI
jgi:hypothetical protein